LPEPEVSREDLGVEYTPPRTALEAHLARRFAEVLGVDRVGVHDNFFELGGDSLRGAVLINHLQEDFGGHAPVRAIFLAPTVAKMAVYLQEYFPEAVGRFLDAQEEAVVEYEFEEEIVRPGQRVDAQKLRQFRALIPALPRRQEDDALPKNPPAVFILSPPRSGSTLLRVMLAGHPRLFAPPELDLLSFNTLGERKAAFQGRYAFWLEGLLRAIMELRGVDAEGARALLEAYERQDMSVKAFYGLLQSWLGDRILVDKTPVYSLHPTILQRMDQDFEDARFIHLIRHPYATIYSFIEAKLDEVFFRWEHPFTRRELAELVWIAAHQNILEFLQHIPQERRFQLRYEDLLADPEGHMRRISEFLGLDYVPAMIDPYSEDRMTTGLEPGKQMVGDYKFYLRKKIDPSAATRWQRFHHHDFLSDIARDLARQLGYEAIEPVTTPEQPHPRIPRAPRTSDLPLSFAQQRLWFIDHLEPGTPLYNIPSAVRMVGPLDVDALAAS
jgi:acyl carrier protein